FQYLASLGIIVLVAAGISQIVARQSQTARPMGIALCICLVSALAAITFRQSRTYFDNRTLYEATLIANPGCWMAHNNLADLFKEANADVAVAHYRAALQLRPDYPQALSNLGLMLTQRRQLAEAIDHLRHAIEIAPGFAMAHNNLGLA